MALRTDSTETGKGEDRPGIWHRVLALVVLACGALIVFLPAVFKGESFYYSDNTSAYLPQKAYFVGALADGRFPLWNARVKCGMPFFADINNGCLYPAGYLFCLLPQGVALAVVVIGHVVIAGLGTWLFLRVLGAGVWPALVGALAFMLSNAVLGLTNHAPLVMAPVWLGAVLALTHKACSTGSPPWAALGAVVLALAIVAGDIHGAYFIYIALALYLPFGIAASVGVRGIVVGTITAVVMVAIVAVLACGLAAVQVAATGELAERSTRPARDESFAMEHSVEPTALVNLVAPGFWGSASSGTEWSHRGRVVCYVGMFALVCAAISLRRWKRIGVIYGLLLAVAAVLLSLGPRTPLFALAFKWLPGFARFRAADEYLFLAVFGLCVMAAHGAADVMRAANERTPCAFSGRTVLAAVAVAACLGAAALFSSHGIEASLGSILAKGVVVATAQRDLAVVARVIDVSLATASAFLAAAVVLVWLAGKGWLTAAGLAVVGTLLVFADVALVGRAVVFTAPAEALRGQGRLASAVREGDHRVACPSRLAATFWARTRNRMHRREDRHPEWWSGLDDVLWRLPDDVGLAYRLNLAGGYTTFDLANFARFVECATGRDQSSPVRTGLEGLDDRFADFLDIKWFVPETADWAKTLARRNWEPATAVFKNPGSPGRYRAVTSVSFARTMDEASRILGDSSFDPNAKAVVFDPTGRLAAGWAASEHHLSREVMIETPQRELPDERSAVTVDTPCEVVLVASDTYYPGWRVRVDGREAELLEANVAFRGVVVPAGRHEVEFSYEPDWLAPAGMISLASCGVCFLVVLGSALARRERSRGD